MQGQASDIQIHAEEILYLRRELNRLYHKHTGQTIEDLGVNALSTVGMHPQMHD